MADVLSKSCILFSKSLNLSTSVSPHKSLKSSANAVDFSGRKNLVSHVQIKSNQASFSYVQVFPICNDAPFLKLRRCCIGKAMRWWQKGLQQNMKEIQSAQGLVDSFLNARNKLVIIDFFSPDCGGCKALHPKISQLAGQHPDVEFLQVNYEEHKSMCYSLNILVLPFFRFYRGDQGRLCGFSCTNSTIKKFKDALEKHNGDYCSLGPPKGLDQSELLALAANEYLTFNIVRNSLPSHEIAAFPSLSSIQTSYQVSKDNALVTAKS